MTNWLPEAECRRMHREQWQTIPGQWVAYWKYCPVCKRDIQVATLYGEVEHGD